MLKKLRNQLLFLITLMATLISSPKVFAADIGFETGGGLKLENPLGTESIIKVISNILNYFIYISVPILAFMILWGGFQILTAREDPEKVKNGRKTIIWASIGFAIILCSKGVALILLKILGG
jgi:hypothetical protein